jgi:hypothetical protein
MTCLTAVVEKMVVLPLWSILYFVITECHQRNCRGWNCVAKSLDCLSFFFLNCTRHIVLSSPHNLQLYQTCMIKSGNQLPLQWFLMMPGNVQGNRPRICLICIFLNFLRSANLSPRLLICSHRYFFLAKKDNYKVGCHSSPSESECFAHLSRGIRCPIYEQCPPDRCLARRQSRMGIGNYRILC